jgi:hypothetical protein
VDAWFLLKLSFLSLFEVRNDLSEDDGGNCNRHGVGSFDEEDKIPRCKRYWGAIFGVVGDAWWYIVEGVVV